MDPSSGLTIASRWSVVIRGGKNPRVTELTSTNPSLRTDKIVPLEVPTFNAVVADVVPAATISNLLLGVLVPIPT